MKRILRDELKEFAQVLVFANTPLSLFHGLTRCSGMRKLRESTTQELSEYYDGITARARRSELVIALAYAVLSAIFIHAQEGNRVDVDASRLLWGMQIRNYLERSNVNTGHFLAPPAKPKVLATSFASTSAPVIFGPDGRPFR